MNTTIHSGLSQFADLIKTRNAIDDQIAAVIDRPASIGHIGEYIASQVFGIVLAELAVNKGHDGYFQDGPLAGKTVNVKFYGKLEFLLDVNPDGIPDYYLVLTGPKATSMTSRGGVRPMLIQSAFLFEAGPLRDSLRERGVRLGVATSVVKSHWEAAEVYPTPRNTAWVLTPEQREALALFGESLDAPRTCRLATRTNGQEELMLETLSQGLCPIPGCTKIFKEGHMGIDAHINGLKHRHEFAGETYEERYADFKAQYPQPWPRVEGE